MTSKRSPGRPIIVVDNASSDGTPDAVRRSFPTVTMVECSRHLGLGDTGAIRVGLAPYTNDEDVDRLLTGLGEIAG